MNVHWLEDPVQKQRVIEHVFGGCPQHMRSADFAAAVVSNNQIVGGLLLTDVKAFEATVWVLFDVTTPISKAFLRDLFQRCFVQSGLKRITCYVPVKNKRLSRFAERIGFRREGALRFAWDGKGHMAVYGLIRKQCRWLR